jgi:hypothetical protein
MAASCATSGFPREPPLVHNIKATAANRTTRRAQMSAPLREGQL